MVSLQKVISLTQKGYSQKEIAEKLSITQVAVSLRLKKARQQGLWNGKSGFEIQPEFTIEIMGKKQKLRGSFRCSRCHKRLIPIQQLEFDPTRLKELLEKQGFTHVCVNCRVAYVRGKRDVG